MNIIRELRKKKGVQQKELSIAIGVSQPTVSDWEKNKNDPSGENLKKLADFFGVDELIIMGRGVIDLTQDTSAPVNRRVIGSSPIWGAHETAVNKRTAVSFLFPESGKNRKKEPRLRFNRGSVIATYPVDKLIDPSEKCLIKKSADAVDFFTLHSLFSTLSRSVQRYQRGSGLLYTR